MAHEPQYVLRFFFDAGSGCCFWSGNDAARAKYDYPVNVDRLPLSNDTRERISRLISRYDTSIDWADPAGPSPWHADKFASFNLDVTEMLKTLPAELGPEYAIVNEFSPSWRGTSLTGACEIAPMQPEDWSAVAEIYRQGIATGNATFEARVPDWPTWDSAHLPPCRLVARTGSQVVAWAALSPVSRRACYSGVAEVSVYVAAEVRGQGIGKQLLDTLVEESEKAGIWTLQASIFPENTASLGLHQSCGFREVGRRERVAQLNGRWRDTVILERRSKVVGV